MIPVPWRSRAETYVLLPLLVLLVLFGSSAGSRYVTDGYWTAAIAKASLMLILIAPICATAAAWEGARQRRGRILDWAIARPEWQLTLTSVAPTLLMGLVGVAVSVMTLAPHAAGAPGWPNPWLIGVYLLVVVAHTMVGYALGRWLPIAVALPAALFSSYLWLAYPAGITPVWIRHLNGLSFEACCAIDQAPAARALVGTGLLAAGSALGVLLALHRSRPARLAALGCLTFSGVLAVTAVWPLGPSPGQPRAGTLACVGAAPRICLWPEQEQSRGVIEAAIRPAYGRLVAAGLDLPPTVTGQDTPDADQLFVPIAAVPNPNILVRALPVSLLAGVTPQCAAEGPWPGGDAYGPLQVWLALTAGAPAEELASTAPPEAIELVNRVYALPHERQLAWYTANRAALNDCNTTLPLDPSGFAEVSR